MKTCRMKAFKNPRASRTLPLPPSVAIGHHCDARTARRNWYHPWHRASRERRSAEAAKYEMSNELVFAWMDGNGFALDLRWYDAHAVLWWHVRRLALVDATGCVNAAGKLGQK